MLVARKLKQIDVQTLHIYINPKVLCLNLIYNVIGLPRHIIFLTTTTTATTTTKNSTIFTNTLLHMWEEMGTR